MDKEGFLKIYKEFGVAHKHMTSVIHMLQELQDDEGIMVQLLEGQVSDAEKKLEAIKELLDQKFTRI